MSVYSQLAYSIKIKFGTDRNEPNDSQIIQIVLDLSKLQALGLAPTLKDWAEVVAKHCPSAGSCHYAGADNSDLNTLLALAIQVAKKKD
jgi:hypothetical protein